MKTLMISPRQKQEIDSFLDQNKKIAAIKYVRSLIPNGGLKDAKYTIDNYSLATHRSARIPGWKVDYSSGYKIVVGPHIKKITCDFGQGDVEVNLETMELKVLTELHTLGIDECGKILDLIEVLKKFSDGEDIVNEDR